MEPEDELAATTDDGSSDGRHIALLLIHGMGEQRPFGLTDLFGRNLADRLPGGQATLSHEIEPGALEEPPGSFLRLTAATTPEDGPAGNLQVDLHEVYWADKPQGLIKLKEVGKWLWWTSLTPLRRWAQSASLFHNPGGPRRRPWGGILRFLGEVGLALALPILGVALFVFALHSALLAASYWTSVEGELTDATFSATVYLLGIVWLTAVAGGLFLLSGGIRTWSAVRFETSLVDEPDLAGHASRWRWMRRWSVGSVLTGLVLLGGAYLLHGVAGVADLIAIVLRLGAEPLRLVLWTAVALVVVVGAFVAVVVALWRLPWESWWWRATRVLGVLAGLAGVAAAVWWLLSRWEHPAKVAFWAVLIGGAAMLSTFLVSSIGDVAIYFDGVDERSRHYQTRQSIIAAATEKLCMLLTSDDTQEVFVVAHSLGSVIAYDAMNRLATHRRVEIQGGPAAPLSTDEFDRLRGFYSFGSPLDKVVYLFHRTTESSTPVLSQLQSSLTSFRRFSSGRPYGPYAFVEYATPTPDGFQWRNAWSWGDVLGHRLDFYDVDSQPHFDYVPLVAHVSFWKDEEFYADLADFVGI